MAALVIFLLHFLGRIPAPLRGPLFTVLCVLKGCEAVQDQRRENSGLHEVWDHPEGRTLPVAGHWVMSQMSPLVSYIGGGTKKPRNDLLENGPLVVQASTAR